MSAPSPKLAIRAAALAAFLATAALGWNLAGGSATAPPETGGPAATSAKTSKRPDRGTGRYGTPAHVRAAMKTIREAGSPEGRMRATIELANSLPVSELGEWLDGRWFDTGEGFDLTLFNKIAKHRWREEDPEGLLLWSFKNGPETANNILNEWAASDPRRMIEFYRQHPNDPMELGSLAVLAGNDPELAIERLREMIGRGISPNHSGYYEQQLLTQLAAKSPAELEAALASLPAAWQAKAEAALVGERLKTSFDDEIRKLWARPDGWKLFESSGSSLGIGAKLLGELENLPASWKAGMASNFYRYLNSSNAEQWIDADLEGGGFTDEQAKRIRMGAMQNLSAQKPELILNYLGEMDLDESDRRNLISNVFANAMRNPGKAEELMALLDSEEDRKVAQAYIDQRNQPQVAAVKVEEPAEWLAQAAAMEHPGSSYQFVSMLRNWDPGKIGELTGQFRAMPDEGKRKIAELLSGQSYGGMELAPSLQGEAIRYLVSDLENVAEDHQANAVNEQTRLAANHAVKWVAKDPVAASEWVQTLPAGEPRLWAQKNLAKNWALYDPQAAGQWVASLPADARTEVQGFMKK
jgi:hypothetical protein